MNQVKLIQKIRLKNISKPSWCNLHFKRKLPGCWSGSFRFIEFHMLVDPRMTVAESHRITDEIYALIRGRLPNATVTIHVEPCDGRCDEECLRTCMLPEEERDRTRSRHFPGKPEETPPG